MLQLIRSYQGLKSDTLRVVGAEFFLQLINAAYFTIFNFYLIDHGYTDEGIAQLIAKRFLVVMLLSLPLGFLIQGRRLLPLLRVAAALIPLSSWLILWSAPSQFAGVLSFAIGVQGAAFAVFQVCMIPYIMRNEVRGKQPEAIALHFSTWGMTGFILGIGIYLANTMAQTKISEAYVLVTLTIVSTIGFLMLLKPMKERVEPATAESRIWRRWQNYDWPAIFNVLTPSLIMGIGAGLTIPFVSLFFYHVFAMEYDTFSLMTAMATFFVTIGSVYGPRILRRYGYHVAITWTQSLAVLTLILMALTEAYAELSWVYLIAIACYMLRQPLMNMGNPIISEFTMNYVGSRNQEVTSALRQSLWAGSWFFSSQIFSVLRAQGFGFAAIFMTTAVIYGVSVIWYYLLILKYHHQISKAGK